MLVKLGGYIVNTRNITLIKETEDGFVEVFFNGGYAEYIKLKIKMGDLVDILGVIENG